MKLRRILSITLACVMLLSAVYAEETATPTDLTSAREAAEESAFVLEGDTLLAYTGCDAHVRIPDGVRTIAARAFCGNEELVEVSLGQVERIEREAFMGCTQLRAVHFSASSLLSFEVMQDGYSMNPASLLPGV